MRRKFFIGFMILVMLVITGCGSEAEAPSPASLQPGAFSALIQLDSDYQATGRAIVRQPAADYVIEMRMSQSDGSPFALITFTVPAEYGKGTYFICPMDNFEQGDCAPNSIGIAYRQVFDGVMTEPLEYASGELTLEALNPFSGTFKFNATFEETGATVSGAFNQVTVIDVVQ